MPYFFVRLFELVSYFCVTNYPSTQNVQAIAVISQVLWVRNPYAVSLSRGCSHGVGRYVTHFKAQLGEDLILSSLVWLLARLTPFLAGGWRHQLLVKWFFPQEYLQHSQPLVSSRVRALREGERESRNTWMSWPPCNSISEETFHDLCHLLFTRSESLFPAPSQKRC